jgi:hypothetical protein
VLLRICVQTDLSRALVKRHTLDLPIIGVAKWKIVGPALEDVTLIYEYAPNTWGPAGR